MPKDRGVWIWTRGLMFLLFALRSGSVIAEEMSLSSIPQACVIAVPERGGQVGYCSASLVEPDVVLTAGHCFEAFDTKKVLEIRIRCGYLGAASDPIQGQWVEDLVSKSVFAESNGRDIDFALIQLAKSAQKITPLRLALDEDEFQSGFAQPDPMVFGDFVLADDVECRFTGFGLKRELRKLAHRTSDQSPKLGLKVYIRGHLFASQSLSNLIARQDFGDSGGPLYCRSPRVPEWTQISIISAVNFRGGGFWMATASPRFAPSYRNRVKKWRQALETEIAVRAPASAKPKLQSP